VFTTAFFPSYGVSGHLYELIDYYYITKISGINSAILLADGLTLETFEKAITDKYDFTSVELDDILSNTVECAHPKIIMSNNICLVDGSSKILDCTIYAENAFLMRCSEKDFEFWANSKSVNHTHLMQDFRMYSERFENLDIEVIDYVKKILWGRYRKPTPTNTNTGLFYLTTACRAIDINLAKSIISKNYCDDYLIITNDVGRYQELASPSVTIQQAPVSDIFEKFDTYIYTPTDWQGDCSPRFVVECAVYGKQVIYEIDYFCAGLQQRKVDIARDVKSLELTESDHFVKYVKNAIHVARIE
jgi:hypothetical protein